MLDPMAMESLVAHLAELSIQGHEYRPLRASHRASTANPRDQDYRIGRSQEDWQSFRGLPVLDPVEHLACRPVEPFTLDARGLSVRLGDREVLHDLSFSAAGGQVLSIAGRNGVGKTTLLRALAGLQPHQGTVQVDGKQPDLAMVFQNPDLQLFNATVDDEILYRVPDPDPVWHRWLVDALGLCDYEHTPPLLLSEGEKKRVALAIALMRKPVHGVLLDEPALGQDAAHKARLARLARALAHAGRLVVMTTHDLSLAAQADRLLLLGETGFVADGPPGEVLRDTASWARAGLTVPGWVLEQMRETVTCGGWSNRVRRAAHRRVYVPSRVEGSPLCQADPRTKLALSTCASLAVMLPLERLALFMALYLLFLFWGRLLTATARQVWRLKWLLVALFAVDWLFVGLDLAVIVTLRVITLASVFTLFVGTTTPDEFRLALERLRVPYRYAFSLSLAFQSVNLLSEEWRAIHEAQLSRGAFGKTPGLRGVVLRLRDWVALTVPAIVLTTRRAWAMTEAACARGFDSPRRHPYRQLAMRWWDWALVLSTAATVIALILW